MAYREFHYEKYYDAPDTSAAYATQMQGISNLFQNLRQRQAERRKASDQFQYDLDEGAFENDTKILTELAKNVTARAKNEMRNSGSLSLETDNLMKQGLGWQQESKNQLERAKMLRQAINDKASKDAYYNPEPDLLLVQDATHGKDNDVDLRTRGERLKNAENAVGGADTFRFNKYRADYVKQIGSQSKERETPLKSGASRTEFNQATFWDPDKGVPGVTDKHAVQFLESDGRVGQYYDQKVNKQLDEEIKQLRKSGDTRDSWIKGLNDEEAKLEIINDPTKNRIDSRDFGTRVRDMAKADLSEADRINSKVSYTNIGGDKNNSGGRWSNQNILHTDAMNTLAQQAKRADGTIESVTSYGPGGRFTQKSGRPIQIDTTNPVRTDTDKGITTLNNKGNLRFNLTGYMLMPQKKTGSNFALEASTPEGMVQEIQNMPLDRFKNLQPKMAVGLIGYSINEAGVLNDIQDQLTNLSSQIADARKTGDKEKLSNLESMEYELNELKNMVGSGDYDQQDLILAGNKAGVRKIQQNYIVPAQDADFATIKNVTGGFNLKDESFWSPEMKMVNDAYQKKYEEAKANNFGEAKGESKSITPEEFNKQWSKLKSGQKLVGPDGKTYTKK